MTDSVYMLMNDPTMVNAGEVAMTSQTSRRSGGGPSVKGLTHRAGEKKCKVGPSADRFQVKGKVQRPRFSLRNAKSRPPSGNEGVEV